MVPKTASEAADQHEFSGGRREKEAWPSSLGHSQEQKRQRALVLRMAFPGACGEGGGLESPGLQGVRGPEA